MLYDDLGMEIGMHSGLVEKLLLVVTLSALAMTGCTGSSSGPTKQLTLAVNSGVEGDALKPKKIKSKGIQGIGA